MSHDQKNVLVTSPGVKLFIQSVKVTKIDLQSVKDYSQFINIIQKEVLCCQNEMSTSTQGKLKYNFSCSKLELHKSMFGHQSCRSGSPGTGSESWKSQNEKSVSLM